MKLWKEFRPYLWRSLSSSSQSIFMQQQPHLGPSSSTNVRNDSSVQCSLIWVEMKCRKLDELLLFRVHLPARFFKTILAYLDVIFMRSICIKFLVLFIASYGSWRHTTYHQAHTMIARLNIHQTKLWAATGCSNSQSSYKLNLLTKHKIWKIIICHRFIF